MFSKSDMLRWICPFAAVVFALSFLPSRASGQEAASPAIAPVVAPVSGSGTTNYIPRWTSSTALGNSKLYQTGGQIGIGTTSPAFNLDVVGRINSSVAYNLKGTTIVAAPNNGLSSGNLALGYNAMTSATSATANTAVGYDSLLDDTTGGGNTAIGYYAMIENTDGFNNAALGNNALRNNDGIFNTAMGYSVMFDNTTGNYNVAMGGNALYGNLTGSSNVAIGEAALINNTSGSFNVAIGQAAAEEAPVDATNNIHIGSEGASTDYFTIRIGDTGVQSSCYIGGIRGAATGNNDAIPVVIDSNGQLGTVSSSRRFKEDIQDMGESSRDLMRLRPVTFRYQKAFADGSKPVQYGLIAEEVGEVYPDLVAHSADGQVESVKYQLLDPMLLNELQRQNKEIEEQRGQIRSQQQEIEMLATQMKSIQAALEAGR